LLNGYAGSEHSALIRTNRPTGKDFFRAGLPRNSVTRRRAVPVSQPAAGSAQYLVRKTTDWRVDARIVLAAPGIQAARPPGRVHDVRARHRRAGGASRPRGGPG